MKTAALLSHYKRTDQPPPENLWERLVWMAANLLRTAEIERHTYRKPCGTKHCTTPQANIQMEMNFK